MASGRYVGFPEARNVAQEAVQSQAQLQPLRKISCRFQNENDYSIFFKTKFATVSLAAQTDDFLFF